MDSASVQLERVVEETISDIKKQLVSRGYRVSNELRNAMMTTLRGQRHGRRYRIPGTKRYYTASAPEEVPAVRTGVFRMSWTPETQIRDGGDMTVLSRLDSRYKINGRVLGDMLENGTTRMAPRPYQEKVLEKVEEKAMRIYRESYF